MSLAPSLERCRRCGGTLGTPWCWDPACPGPAARLERDPVNFARDELAGCVHRAHARADELETRVCRARHRADVRRLLAALEIQIAFLPEGAL